MKEWDENDMMEMQFALSGILDAPKIGHQFTTAKTGLRGEVCEIVRNRTGSFRLRLNVDGETRWTTATVEWLESGEWK